MRRLGIDPGSQRIGLALSDEASEWAHPLRTLRRQQGVRVVDEICEEVRSNEVGEVIIGLPLELDGSEGVAARRARRFAAELKKHCSVPICMWDERFSTAQVTRDLIQAGASRKRRRDVVDQAAATLMLQSYLDAQRD